MAPTKPPEPKADKVPSVKEAVSGIVKRVMSKKALAARARSRSILGENYRILRATCTELPRTGRGGQIKDSAGWLPENSSFGRTDQTAPSPTSRTASQSPSSCQETGSPTVRHTRSVQVSLWSRRLSPHNRWQGWRGWCPTSKTRLPLHS